jgi:hypothetical protein
VRRKVLRRAGRRTLGGITIAMRKAGLAEAARRQAEPTTRASPTTFVTERVAGDRTANLRVVPIGVPPSRETG